MSGVPTLFAAITTVAGACLCVLPEIALIIIAEIHILSDPPSPEL